MQIYCNNKRKYDFTENSFYKKKKLNKTNKRKNNFPEIQINKKQKLDKVNYLFDNILQIYINFIYNMLVMNLQYNYEKLNGFTYTIY